MTDLSPRPPSPASARRVAFPPNWPTRIACIALAFYVVYACSILDINRDRLMAGFAHAARFVSRMFPPNFAPDKLELLYTGMLESLQIAIIATAVGVLLSLPLGLIAARNLSPMPLAWAARALIVLFRTFHPVIIAILFVKAVGFGALAGVLALIVASLGFLSKLVAEAVEEMSMQQVEAVRATGAPFLSLVIMGVRRSWRASSDFPHISSIRTYAIRRWSGSWAAAASAQRCSPRFSASTTISC